MAASGSPVPPPDGGWGWVIMLSAFFNTMAVFGVLKSGGVLYVAIVDELHVTRSQAAFVTSFAFSLSCLLAPLASSLSSHFSHRCVIFAGAVLSAFGVVISALLPTLTIMTVFYGGLMGFGTGLIAVPSITIVHEYFHRYRSFTSAFAMAGGSVGCLSVPPLFEFVLEKYGLYEGLLTLAAILLQICPSTMLLRPVEMTVAFAKNKTEKNGVFEMEQKKTKTNTNGKEDEEAAEAFLKAREEVTRQNGNAFDGTQKRTVVQRLLSVAAVDPSIFKEKYFYLIAFSMVCFTYSWLSYLTIIKEYALNQTSEPISPRMAVLLFSYMAIGDLVVRIAGGWLMDRKWINRRYAYSVFLIGLTVLMFFYVPTHSYAALVAITVIFGMFVSGLIILPAILLVDLLGPVRFPMAFGICCFLNGIVILFAGPSIAFIRDLYGSYQPCILVMATVMLCAAISWTFDVIYVRMKKTPIEKSSSDAIRV